MYKEIRKKAKKKVDLKISFYTCTIIFSFTTVILLMLSFYLPWIAFWLRLPIPVFVMVLSVLYLFAFGLPFSGSSSKDWREEEIEKEMLRLFRRRKVELPPLEAMSDEEVLELRELENLERKWNWDRNEDFV